MALTILVVEDSGTLRRRLVDAISAIAGVAHVHETSSVAAARAFLSANWADVFVVDIALEDGSGLDVLREMRRGQRQATVIMLTHQSSLLYRHNCLAAGADFLLDKSTDFDSLIEIVSALASTGLRS